VFDGAAFGRAVIEAVREKVASKLGDIDQRHDAWLRRRLAARRQARRGARPPARRGVKLDTTFLLVGSLLPAVAKEAGRSSAKVSRCRRSREGRTVVERVRKPDSLGNSDCQKPA
jgi:hypothetical protein